MNITYIDKLSITLLQNIAYTLFDTTGEVKCLYYTDHLNMTIAVDWDMKSQIKQTIFCVANLIRNEQVVPQHVIITSSNHHYSLSMTDDCLSTSNVSYDGNSCEGLLHQHQWKEWEVNPISAEFLKPNL